MPLLLFKSTCVGIALSCLTAAVALIAAMAGPAELLTAFLMFGSPVGRLLASGLPAGVLHALFPIGGGRVIMVLSAVASLLQLALVYGAGFWWIGRRKLRASGPGEAP